MLIRQILISLMLAAALATTATAQLSATTQPPGPEATVRANLDAFNRQDVEALVATVAEDFVWYNVDGDKLLPETRGREALRKGMQSYFKSLPSARSSAEVLTVNGDFVSIRERATWKNNAGESASQAAIGVYEVREGLIRRVWYFPAQK